MRRGSRHTEEHKAKMRAVQRSKKTKALISAALLNYNEEKRATPNEPNIKRHEEPILSEEVKAAQDRMLARFGRHKGKKVDHAPASSDLSKYGMEVCHACHRLTAVDFPCAHCDAERPVIVEDQRKVA